MIGRRRADVVCRSRRARSEACRRSCSSCTSSRGDDQPRALRPTNVASCSTSTASATPVKGPSTTSSRSVGFALTASSSSTGGRRPDVPGGCWLAHAGPRGLRVVFRVHGPERHPGAGGAPRQGPGLARGAQATRRPPTRAPRRSTRTTQIAARRAWQARLTEGGLNGTTWPAEFGGQGLGPLHQVVTNQEIGAAGVPGILDVIGVGMLGPTIIAHGAEEQKERYLLPMLRGDEVWCQLFSEPAAGSDLAAVQTRAKRTDGRLGAQRPEGVDDQRAVRPVRAAARAHGRRRAQAQGPDDVHRADGRARA